MISISISTVVLLACTVGHPVPTVGILSALPSPVEASANFDSIPLTWKDEKGFEEFTKAQKAFEDGDYKTAEASFKAAGKLAKGGKTSKYVKKLRAGSRLMMSLTAQVAAGQKRKALKYAEDNTKAFADTPVEGKLIALTEELVPLVFHVLEDFEKNGPYSEKYGKSWVTDEALVKQGKRALKWVTTGQDPELKIKDLPKSLTSYEAIALWVYFPKKSGGFDMIFKCKGTSKTAVTQTTITNAYFHSQSAFKGWKRLEIPLKRFKPQGDVSWSDIADFRLKFQGKRNATLYVDDIVLVRKDGEAKKK